MLLQNQILTWKHVVNVKSFTMTKSAIYPYLIQTRQVFEEVYRSQYHSDALLNVNSNKR